MLDRDYNWRHPRVRVSKPAPSPLADAVVDAIGYALALALVYLAWWL